MTPSHAPQKCHNCRRRRLRCDRSLPECRKCAEMGQACLGYGKLFIWTNAVASRGKRAGHASFGPQIGGGGAPRSPSTLPRPVVRSTPTTPFPVSSTPSSSLASCAVLNPQQHALVLSPHSTASRQSSPGTTWTLDYSGLAVHSLLDPVVQDFDAMTRYYLHYYSERVAGDLVVHDIPDRNPFRNLVPLCRRQTFLQHVVVALSAIHQVSLLRSRGLPLRTRLLDALTAKHKAIVLVKDALEHLGPHNYSDVLTAVVFLINFELLDSGRDSWKAHVEAAGRLIAMLQSSGAAAAAAAAAAASAKDQLSLPSNGTTGSSICALRDYIMSDCLTFFILGSTLGSWEGTGASEVFGSLDVLSMLMRAESNSYHSCPSEVLSTILRSSQLASQMHRQAGGPTPVQKEAALSLMRRLSSFDARRWAEAITEASHSGGVDDLRREQDIAALERVRIREHMASAHRSAACAYLLMAAPQAFARSSGAHEQSRFSSAMEDFGSDIYRHLGCIPETDVLFKGSVWPTFILGAQAADPARRAWVKQRLAKMWQCICPWGYVRTAMETLEALWKFRDGESEIPSSSSNPPRAAARNAERREWLSELEALKVDCLIV